MIDKETAASMERYRKALAANSLDEVYGVGGAYRIGTDREILAKAYIDDYPDGADLTRRELMNRQLAIQNALEDLVTYYECEMERSEYDDEDVPEELRELENNLQRAYEAPTERKVL